LTNLDSSKVEDSRRTVVLQVNLLQLYSVMWSVTQWPDWGYSWLSVHLSALSEDTIGTRGITIWMFTSCDLLVITQLWKAI